MEKVLCRFRGSLEIFGISEEGLMGRFLGYVRVLYRAFRVGRFEEHEEIFGIDFWDLWKGPKR